MDIGAYFSRSHDLFKEDSLKFLDCDPSQCQSHDPTFSGDSPADVPSMDELESSSQHGYCHSYKDDCIPVIFDRNYNFADRELCSRNFSVRLGGFRHKMAAVLRRYIGCKVIIGVDCDKNKKIHGRISLVGTDFVEVNLYKGSNDSRKEKKYRMVPFYKINWFKMDQENNS